MSEVFRCDDKATLVAYLYGELENDVRREVDRHLRTCAACTRETEGLQAVRHDLQSWMPPEPGLEFSITQRMTQPTSATVLTSSRWSSLRAVPAWAGVAAAALVVGVAASIANVQIRSTSDGVVVTTGWMQPQPQPAPVVPARAPNDEWRGELARLEQTLRTEMAAQHTAVSAATRVRETPSLDMVGTAAVLRRVEALIAQSEERQRQEIAAKLVKADLFWRTQRREDLLQINRSFGSLQSRQLNVQANQKEMLKQVDNLRRVSFAPPNQ
jgi:hypothetical protein